MASDNLRRAPPGISVAAPLAYAVKPFGEEAVLVFAFCSACLAVIVARRVFGRKRL